MKHIWAEDRKHRRRRCRTNTLICDCNYTHSHELLQNQRTGVLLTNQIHTKMHWHTLTDTKGRRGSDRTDCLFQSLQRAYWFFPHCSFYTPPFLSPLLCFSLTLSKGAFIFFFLSFLSAVLLSLAFSLSIHPTLCCVPFSGLAPNFPQHWTAPSLLG